MTCHASFVLDWSVFVSEWALFISMTLKTRSITASRKSRLFEFKATMRVMTVTTLHRTFQNLVVERLVEIRLYLTMAAKAELWLALFKERNRGEVRLLSIRRPNKRD
jgi:hypothetical protein